ncbi:MAG: histidine phosphatase family protein [Desulfarculus sp.]|nr:histidine phosphatase family protein [Pseudomonadota bacterium]MBV1716424.1 histidine phosphatase family protein [Desulfarculus sp.]MBU4573662.1 histidine phosphatase family protein [Pseudomonadota bacterium]MBU4598573.1 histidine phosphatase family protein [Pseudomonadota bacterium]MBV1736908.1 histidine phosphatase family protein [Desulfarculus sp.]
MSVLYMMRHGQASFGQDNYDRLSDLGLRQAALTGEHLARLGLSFDAAYCGTMSRQQATARAALEALPSPPQLQVLPEFNEYESIPIIKSLLPAMRREDPAVDKAAPHMLENRKAFQTVYEGAMRRWISGRYPLDQGEAWDQFQARVQAALERVRADNGRGKTVLVFTSGGPISAALRLALGLGDETALRITWVIKNASLSSFFYNDRDFSLSLFNSTTHLELHQKAELITYR